MASSDPNRALRHTVATLAYRATKALRDFPAAHATTRVAPTTRTPLELLSHLGDLMRWAATMAHGATRTVITGSQAAWMM